MVPVFYVLFFFTAKCYYSKTADGALVEPNMRFEAINIIRNCQFDSIILGSSMLENTSSAEASRLIGGKFINVSMSGSNFYERAIILKRALKSPIKRVIYSVDSIYIDYHDAQSDPSLKDWRKLYEESIDVKSLLAYLNPKMHMQYNIDRPNAWFNQPYHACRFGGIDKWVENMDKQGMMPFLTKELPEQALLSKNKIVQMQVDVENELIMRNYLDENLLSIVRTNPNTEFHLIFPPYFKYSYARIRQNDSKKFYLHQQAIRYIVNCTKELPNLFVYGFENQQFTANIANYKDTFHYIPEFNTLFLESIATKRNLLLKENVEAYLRECEAQAYEFDISKLAAEAQRLIDAAISKYP